MASNEWLYSKSDDHQQGPVSGTELNRLASLGELLPDDLVWKEGMDEWVPANRVKGLCFSSPPNPQSNGGTSSNRLDSESLQSTFRDVQEHAEKAAETFWFFDLKFNRFVSATIIQVVWTLYLIIGSLGILLGFLAAILSFPILQAVFFSVVGVLTFLFLTLLLRVGLEGALVLFRMAESMRQVNEKLTPREG